MHVFVIGYPGDVGGANTELWHTVKFWRHAGIDVTLLPAGKADPTWKTRLDALGCCSVEAGLESLHTVAGLPGRAVVGFCNSQFLAAAPRLRELGCRTVWVSCMNWLFPAERLLYARAGTFDRHVFQSRQQRERLVPQLRRWGFPECRAVLIRGAMSAGEFPFAPRPHAAGQALVVGRISRAEPDKFPRNLWRLYARIPQPMRARVLGWSGAVEAQLGTPPVWAECLPAGAAAPREFLATLHVLVPGGAAIENWPRVGLEAMAAGVPLVVPAEGGWQEMVRHGQTGYLSESDTEAAGFIARLARDEAHRLAIAAQAREALVHDLAEPSALADKWRELFDSLQGGAS